MRRETGSDLGSDQLFPLAIAQICEDDGEQAAGHQVDPQPRDHFGDAGRWILNREEEAATNDQEQGERERVAGDTTLRRSARSAPRHGVHSRRRRHMGADRARTTAAFRYPPTAHRHQPW